MNSIMSATSDKMADENKTCEYCDRLVSSPNFAYHFCTGRKLFKGSRPTTGAVDLGDSSALEVDSAPEVLSAGQGESHPAPNH